MTTRYSLPLLLILLLVLLPFSIDPRGGVLLAEDEAGKEKVVRRSIPLEDNYLLIPIQNGAPSIAVDFEILPFILGIFFAKDVDFLMFSNIQLGSVDLIFFEKVQISINKVV